MPTPQSEVNQELFRRVNALEQVYNETNGYLKGIVESNEKIIKQNDNLIGLIEKRDKTMGRVMWGLLILLLFTACHHRLRRNRQGRNVLGEADDADDGGDPGAQRFR